MSDSCFFCSQKATWKTDDYEVDVPHLCNRGIEIFACRVHREEYKSTVGSTFVPIGALLIREENNV